jgi:hypothetical protein
MMETENMLGSTHQHHRHIIMQYEGTENVTTIVQPSLQWKPYQKLKFHPMIENENIDHVAQWEPHQKLKLHLMMETDYSDQVVVIDQPFLTLKPYQKFKVLQRSLSQNPRNISEATQCKLLTAPVSMLTCLVFSWCFIGALFIGMVPMAVYTTIIR